MNTAQRKQRLIQEGAGYRSGLINATDDLKNGFHPGLLLRGVMGHVVSAATGALKGSAGVGKLGLPALVPLVMSGLTMFARRSMIKPAIGGAIALGAIAATVRYISRQRNSPPG